MRPLKLQSREMAPLHMSAACLDRIEVTSSDRSDRLGSLQFHVKLLTDSSADRQKDTVAVQNGGQLAELRAQSLERGGLAKKQVVCVM